MPRPSAPLPARLHTRRDRWVRRGRDRGSAGLELAIVTPAVFLLIALVLQVGLWYHARHVAFAIAQEGARAARSQHPSVPAAQAAGTARASDYLTRLGSTVMLDVDIDVTRNADVASVRVRATALRVLPFVSFPIDEVSTGPVERFRSSLDPV